MSKIYTALRAIELEQNEQQTEDVGSKLQNAASTADEDEFAVLREFTAPGTLQLVHPSEQVDADPPPAEPEAPAVKADGFSVLEKRIAHVAEVVRQERQDRMAAEERALHAEEQVSEQALRIQTLARQVDALKNESQDRRRRVVKMLAALDSLQS
ncbi:MAG: hypothetical protein ABSF23_06350 [Terracidiphilus sp.]